MPAVQTLQALYIEELRDLCSANQQMQAVVGKMADRASDQKLQAFCNARSAASASTPRRSGPCFPPTLSFSVVAWKGWSRKPRGM